MSSILTVLFDADGVIQDTAPDWTAGWVRMLPSGAPTDGFINAIFEMERPYLNGQPGFQNAVIQLMDQWQITAPIEDFLAVWTAIVPAAEILSIVDDVKRSGTAVGLATNQQQYRYDFMTSAFGYRSLFNHLFVSCDLGIAKPGIDYFKQISTLLDEPPDALLFIDDNEPNVLAARAAGLQAETFHLSEGPARLLAILDEHKILHHR